MELAALANEPVVAVAEMVAMSEYESVPLVLVMPTREVKPFEVDEQLPLQASAAPVQQAEYRDNAQRLPQTASNVPLFAALGLAFLLAGLGVGVLSKQSA